MRSRTRDTMFVESRLQQYVGGKVPIAVGSAVMPGKYRPLDIPHLSSLVLGMVPCIAHMGAAHPRELQQSYGSSTHTQRTVDSKRSFARHASALPGVRQNRTMTLSCGINRFGRDRTNWKQISKLTTSNAFHESEGKYMSCLPRLRCFRIFLSFPGTSKYHERFQ